MNVIEAIHYRHSYRGEIYGYSRTKGRFNKNHASGA